MIPMPLPIFCNYLIFIDLPNVKCTKQCSIYDPSTDLSKTKVTSFRIAVGKKQTR